MNHLKCINQILRRCIVSSGILLATANAYAVTDDQQVDFDIDMECSFPIIGSVPISIEANAKLPKRLEAGSKLIKVAFDASTKIGSSLLSGGLKIANIGSLKGNVTVGVTWGVGTVSESFDLNGGNPFSVGDLGSGLNVSGFIDASYIGIQNDNNLPVILYASEVQVNLQAFNLDGTSAAGDLQSFSDQCTFDPVLIRTINVYPAVSHLESDAIPLDFGKVTPLESKTKTVTFKNIGVNPQQIAQASLMLQNPDRKIGGYIPSPHFTIKGDTCSNTTLALGRTCQVDVEFLAPNEDGHSYYAFLWVGDEVEPYTLSVNAKTGLPSGTVSLPGQIEPGMGTLGFGEVFFGESKTKTISMSNSGVRDLSIFDINAMLNSDFSLVDHNCDNLSPSEACDIRVRYTPSPANVSDSGDADGILYISSDDSVTEVTAVVLTAIGKENNLPPAGNSKVDLGLLATGTVKLDESKSFPLTGTMDGTLDRDGGILDLDYKFEKSVSKGIRQFGLPVTVTMQIEDGSLQAKMENASFSELTSNFSVSILSASVRLFGLFNVPLSVGSDCKIVSGGGSISFSIEKLNLDGSPTRLTASLGGGEAQNCGGINDIIKDSIGSDSKIELDIQFTKPAL